MKEDTIRKVKEVGIVAVVRAKDSQEAFEIAKACIAGGVPAIEITYTVPGATEVIRSLKSQFSSDELLVGAGTVLDATTARLAIEAGAEYVVSPGFDAESAQMCNRYGVPYMPGCITPTEVMEALKYGAAIIKVFPGSLTGPSYIKALKGPFPQGEFMPTGGVDLSNVGEWVKAGVAAVGVGGQLTAGAKSGDYKKITETAKAFVAEIKKARGC